MSSANLPKMNPTNSVIAKNYKNVYISIVRKRHLLDGNTSLPIVYYTTNYENSNKIYHLLS